MAFIFQCDCCGQREPEVAQAATLISRFINEERHIEVCHSCKPLLAKELDSFYQHIKEHKHGNT